MVVRRVRTSPCEVFAGYFPAVDRRKACSPARSAIFQKPARSELESRSVDAPGCGSSASQRP